MRTFFYILLSIIFVLFFGFVSYHANAAVVQDKVGGAKFHKISLEVYPDASTVSDQQSFIRRYLLGRTAVSFYRSGDNRPITYNCVQMVGYIAEGEACKAISSSIPDGDYVMKVPVISGYKITLYKDYWSNNSFTGNFAHVTTNISGGSYFFRTRDIYPKYEGVAFAIVYSKK